MCVWKYKERKGKTKKGGTKESNESILMNWDIIPNLRAGSIMAAISSGMGYGVNIISFVLWIMGDKVGGEGPLIQCKGGS